MFNKATFDAFVINCFFFCVAMHGLGAEVKECDFNQDFLSDSYLLIFSPYGTKNVSFNS